MDHIAERLAERGYVAVNASYRFAPKFAHPAQLDDLRRALRWMRVNAERFKIDGKRIAAFGYSAGGHLAALLGTVAGRDELAAVVAGGAPTDLREFPESEMIATFLGTTFAEGAHVYRDASPIVQVSPDDPPMFLYHGERDWTVPVEQAVKMQAALESAGVPNELYLVRWLGHVAVFFFNDASVEAAIDFLDRHLKR